MAFSSHVVTINFCFKAYCVTNLYHSLILPEIQTCLINLQPTKLFVTSATKGWLPPPP